MQSVKQPILFTQKYTIHLESFLCCTWKYAILHYAHFEMLQIYVFWAWNQMIPPLKVQTAQAVLVQA